MSKRNKIIVFIVILLILLVLIFVISPKALANWRWRQTAQAVGGLPYQIGLTKVAIIQCITTGNPPICAGGPLCATLDVARCTAYSEVNGTPSGGMGLDGLLRGRGNVLSGILNGIDDTEWNPATDEHLAARFDAADSAPRALNKAELQARFGLRPDPAAPLFVFIGRLAWQKGVDLVLEALPALLAEGGQLAILGTGEAELEERCLGAAQAHHGRIGAVIGFDEALARLGYGGADAVLVPSRFEPCGLAQLCALRYGAPPVVARVGGLADTVIDANEAALAAGTGTGVQFAPPSAEALAAAIQRTVALFRDAPAWAQVQRNAMAADVSWRRSAARYAALFHGLVHG